MKILAALKRSLRIVFVSGLVAVLPSPSKEQHRDVTAYYDVINFEVVAWATSTSGVERFNSLITNPVSTSPSDANHDAKRLTSL
jgi:hypothetical protein